MLHKESFFDGVKTTLHLYTLENDQLRLELTELGAAMLQLTLKAPSGEIPVLRGETDSLWRLLHKPYYSAIVGRCANRIAGGAFELEGKHFQLEANEAPHHLHGGTRGFHTQLWRSEADDHHVSFSLRSPAGDCGYPGTLDCTVTYSLEGSKVRISLEGKSDASTLFNLTSHNYFNLDPEAADIRDHLLRLRASSYTESDASLIPTGRILQTSGTALDFSVFRRLSPVLHEMKALGIADGGLDHNFVLEPAASCPGRPCAELYSPKSEVCLSCETDLPGLQVYSCQHGGADKSGFCALPPYFALCLEPQFYPDAVHHPNFPQPVLKSGQTMHHDICYDVRKIKKEDLL